MSGRPRRATAARAAARLVALVLLAAPARAQASGSAAGDAVRYEVAIEGDRDGAVQRTTARWRVRATLPHDGAGELDFWLPRWTAGAYHLAEYGEFVDEFAARDATSGAPLPVARDGKCRFVIAAGAATSVVVDYVARPCAQGSINQNMILSVEGNRIGRDYAFVSPNSLLGFVAGEQDRPCAVRFALPDGWRVASALPAADDGTLRASSWWQLEDSPALLGGALETVPFEVDGVPHAFTLGGGDPARAATLADHCRRIAEAGRDWMQGLPYANYHFLVQVDPLEQGGAGLEHHDSTLIVIDPPTASSAELDHLLAHEYFHLWCAERIHVAALDRPDYTQPIRTGTIWANEGITEYFCRHLLVRAGLRTRAQFFAGLAEEGRTARTLWPAAADRSWSDVSREASEWDDFSDLMAFTVKHYQGGCFTVFALDLEMRAASGGERGVADLLRYLHHAHGARGRGYGEEALPAIVAGIAQADLDPFFAAYVDGNELPKLKERLAVIGYTVKGGLQEIVPVPSASFEQSEALEDFFRPPPALRSIR
ncbi:MAG: M61 family metallopeptidase [Planctomycetes bacterium]|nr:M61 family metallopeptidase [Planctomycetota bacterium]